VLDEGEHLDLSVMFDQELRVHGGPGQRLFSRPLSAARQRSHGRYVIKLLVIGYAVSGETVGVRWDRVAMLVYSLNTAFEDVSLVVARSGEALDYDRGCRAAGLLHVVVRAGRVAGLPDDPE
jgi:hypothetical protein